LKESLSKLDEESSKQVEIEAKFLEVQEGALDEISFDWQYSWGNSQMLMDETFMPVLDSVGVGLMRGLMKRQLSLEIHAH
jgi:hypothetical protein